MTDASKAHILFILDNSGSMHGIASDMNGAIEEFIQEQKKNFTGTVLYDIVRFDQNVEYSERDTTDPKGPFIVPRGSTALLDGIGIGVTTLGDRLAELDEDERPGKVIVVVVTDGFENASREYTEEVIKEIVMLQTETYKWDFVYLGANQDSFKVAGNLGFAKGSTMNYAADAVGTRSVFAAASAYATTALNGQQAAFSDTDRQAAVQSR